MLLGQVVNNKHIQFCILTTDEKDDEERVAGQMEPRIFS